MTRDQRMLFAIGIITLLALIIDLPRIKIPRLNQTIGGYQLNLNLFGASLRRDLTLRTGLDIQGGTRITLEAMMEKIEENDRESALQSAKEIISRRIDAFGVAEPNIYTSTSGDQYRIVVELPGVTNVQKAIQLIGQTAQLNFREIQESEKENHPQPSQSPSQGETPKSTPTPPTISFKPTDLTGKDLKRAQVIFDPKTGSPMVQLQFNQEGAQKFEEITGRNVGKPLAIFLDDQLIEAPLVNQKITGGRAVITGNFSLEKARQLAIQLNAGALPVPVKVIGQQNIGPTLGQESVQKSIRAGLAGLFLIAFFMVLVYRSLGLIAVIGLIIYSLITLALYKLIPVTLTLSGIAGFLLSISMAVDANILIFERIKEEIAAGKRKQVATELGFRRAWDSIRDANMATLITVFVLFNPFNWKFLVTSGMVRGFALTLGLGILISLFTGVIVTRTLIRVFYKKGVPEQLRSA